MKSEIICVGTELLLGNIVNTDAQYISVKLAELGIDLYTQTVVGDNYERLADAIRTAVSRCDIIILTGGLGPTADDITKQAVANTFSRRLIGVPEILEKLKDYYARQNRPMPDGTEMQSRFPEESVVFPNDNGTAPGFMLNEGEKKIIVLPGPPRELQPMFENYVFPRLKQLSDSVILSRNLMIYGIGESDVANSLGEKINSANPTYATYAKLNEVQLRITAKGKTETEANGLLDEAQKFAEEIFGDCIYCADGSALSEKVVSLLKEKRLKIATAESCTAGLLSKTITDISGSSEVFDMGVSAYANEVKSRVLGVPEDLLLSNGAVDPTVAAYMAKGIREISGADIGVGITGVAGPASSEGKPVGLVYVALADGKNVWVRKLTAFFHNDRERIRHNSTLAALDLARRYLTSLPLVMGGAAPADGEPIVLCGADEFSISKEMPQETIEEMPIVIPVSEPITDEAEKLNNEKITDENLQNIPVSEPITDEAEEVPQEVSEEIPQEEVAENTENAETETNAVSSETDEAEEVPQESPITDISEADDTPERARAVADEFNAEYMTADADEFLVISNHSSKRTVKAAMKAEKKAEKEAKRQEAIKQKYLDRYDKMMNGGEKKKPEKQKKSEKETEKKPKKRGFFKNLFPNKSDSVGEVIRKTAFLVSLLIFIGTVVYLAAYFSKGFFNERAYDRARELYETADSGYNDEGMLIRFEELYKQNSDIKGWVRIDGTVIDYPVYQTDNNDYYIDHDMSKSENRYGAVFADCAAKIKRSGNSDNIVLYGHNMIDKSMFGALLDYTNLKFYREHPLVKFNTLYKQGEYKVFAVFITNANEEDDDGYVFNYRATTFGDENNFDNWIDNVLARSVIKTGVDVKYGDEVLTLSTCSYEFEDARTVVMARRVRTDESSYIDTSAAKKNKEPLYPQAYYDKNGGKKPKLDLAYYLDPETSGLAYTANAIKGYQGNDTTVYTTDDIYATDKDAKKVKVSKYVGLSLPSAIRLINEDGLYISEIEYDGAKINSNQVLKQSIKAGSEVNENTGIVLNVSGSPAKISTPDFVGLKLSEAEEKASEAGLTLQCVMVASRKKANTVLIQAVKPKTKVTDRNITVYVSNGMNKLPDVVGLKVEKAKKRLKFEGFKYKIIKITTVNKAQIDMVCSQTIDAGQYAKLGSKITLYVGKKGNTSVYTSTAVSITSSKGDTSSTDKKKKDKKNSSEKNTSSKNTSSDNSSSSKSSSSTTTGTTSTGSSSSEITSSSTQSETSSEQSSSDTSSDEVTTEPTENTGGETE